MDDNEKTAALEWARKKRAEYGVIADRTAGDPIGPVPEVVDEIAAHALLDTVRLILEPFEGECVYCGWPINANQEQHAEDCPALPWVRAAARAGL